MPLTPQRLSPPVKGVNSTTPLREMSPEFAVTLDNVWFDQGQYITRRPCQKVVNTETAADAAAGNATATDSTKHILEHISPAGAAKLFTVVETTATPAHEVYAWDVAGSPDFTYQSVGFTNRPRSAQLGDVTILADGATAPQSYTTAGGWAALTSLPAGVTELGNILHTHKARMYNSAVAAQTGYVYYSDTITDTIYTGTAGGAVDWLVASGGGFINAGAAIAGNDTVTGLASYKGFLVVFMKNHIIFYSGADPASDFAVAKVINGIGCVSQDSIQGTGNDLVFLSQYGFKSLEQILVQGDAAAKSSSVPINNKVVSTLAATTTADIRSEFIETLGVYVCNMRNITFVYHVFFDSWTYWYDIQPQLFKRLDGTALTVDSYIHELSDSNKGDTIGLGSETAVVMTWELPPIKAAGNERKARWNRMELVYEAEASDAVTIESYVDVKASLKNSEVLTLSPTEPSATVAGTAMLWTVSGTGTSSRQRWGGTPNNDTTWSDGFAVLFSGSDKLPLIGRGEFMSIKIINSAITRFRITAVELFSIIGGLR
ncbi:MAG: hypothetical protein GQ474_00470 [Sulfurimonas sp.]|nr:hypothetical protein [Sulfurimonas sp.]